MSAPGGWRKLGVVAGGGALPLRVAEAALESGRPVHVIAIDGFADAEAVSRFPHETAGVGEIGKMIDAFKRAGCDAVTFAGVVKRPDLSKVKVDFAGAKLLPKALMAARKGDDALLRVILEAFEKAGFEVLGAEAAAGGLKADEGVLGALSPGAEHAEDIAKALEIARVMGEADIGQGAVVCDGLVLAVEAQEGTDRMLARVAELPAEIRGNLQARRGVLAKAPKPVQDRRIDLPTIGVATVEGAARAGLAGVVVEAGGALVIDRAAVAAAADAAGLFVLGAAPPDSDREAG